MFPWGCQECIGKLGLGVAHDVASARASLAQAPVTKGGRGASELIEADALVIVTEWRQFRALDLKRIKQEMKHPVVVDLRNIYRPDEMAAHGFTYESIGRPR